MKIRLVLAFDHELSLGGTRDYARNLFEPTDALLELANVLGVPIVLFTDVLCALAHERRELRAFTVPYRAQLARALAAGADVQLHLHPHWLTSHWNDAGFVPSERFALAHYPGGDGAPALEEIVARGVGALTAWCAEVRPAYRCVAFRAGGYALAPATARILAALAAAGIRFDSSIAPGFIFRSALSHVDFRRVPARANWFLDPAGTLTRAGGGGILEVPIASAPRTPANNLPFLARRVLHRGRRYRDGGHSIHDGRVPPAARIARLFPRSAWMLSFDNYADGVDDVFRVFARYVAAHADEEEIVCASVSHPKSMGAHARALMRGFVARVRERYGEALEFTTFTELANARWAEPSNGPAHRVALGRSAI